VYSKGAFGGVVGGVDYSAGCAYFGAEGFGLFGQSKSENKYTGDFEFDRTSETKRVFGVLGKVGAKIGGAVAYLQGGYVGSSIHTAGRVNTNADETDEVKVKEDHTLHGLGGGAGVDMALSNGLTVGASFLYSAAPNKKLFADYKAGDGDDAQNMTMDLTHHNTMGLVSVKYRVGGM
jgi:opacity protein-like surface antigen